LVLVLAQSLGNLGLLDNVEHGLSLLGESLVRRHCVLTLLIELYIPVVVVSEIG
jgi:hypothetical protein